MFFDNRSSESEGVSAAFEQDHALCTHLAVSRLNGP